MTSESYITGAPRPSISPRPFNPATLDPYGFKGEGLYNFTHPGLPIADRTMWAKRGHAGLILLSNEQNGSAVTEVTEEEFRNNRDWPVPIGGDCFIINGTAVRMEALSC